MNVMNEIKQITIILNKKIKLFTFIKVKKNIYIYEWNKQIIF